jgi:hypothetical protein
LICSCFGLAAHAQDPPTLPATGQPSVTGQPLGLSADPLKSTPAEPDWLDYCQSIGGHFEAGGGFYFLKPYFNGNAAFTIKSTTSNPGPVNLGGPMLSTTNPGLSTSQSSSSEQDFDYDASFSPLLWLAYTGENGLGARARWWHFDQGASLTVSNSDPTGATEITSAGPRGLSLTSPGRLLKTFGLGTDRLAFDTDLKIDSWDFEVTQAVAAGKWALAFSGGVRYAHLAQDYHAFRFNSGSNTDFNFSQDSTVLISGFNFNGAGPTLCLEGRRPLGETGLAFYASGRGSLLFGRCNQQVDKLTVFAGNTLGGPANSPALGGPFNSQTSVDSAASQDRVLPVVELEVGGEYAPQLFGPATRVQPFVRAGLIGQSWFGGGNASGPGSNLGFLGLSVTAGVEF